MHAQTIAPRVRTGRRRTARRNDQERARDAVDASAVRRSWQAQPLFDSRRTWDDRASVDSCEQGRRFPCDRSAEAFDAREVNRPPRARPAHPAPGYSTRMFTDGRFAMETVAAERTYRPDGVIELAAPAPEHQTRELAFRASDGLEVTLLW